MNDIDVLKSRLRKVLKDKELLLERTTNNDKKSVLRVQIDILEWVFIEIRDAKRIAKTLSKIEGEY